ncbi:MAG TPA: hypothetical protein VFL84_06715 [Gammaproteobacteria bacterium]|nr:hypothetical protein [Gammaproteobacteria bacterium]
MRTLMAVLVAAAFAGTASAAKEPPATATYFDEAKITVNERASADGFIRVRVVPENGTALEATIPIRKRENENELARTITDGLNAVLAPSYGADKDGGEHVKIKKKSRDAANFSVEITFNVPGFSIVLDK